MKRPHQNQKPAKQTVHGVKNDMIRKSHCPKLRGIRRVQQDGKVYKYHRATGTRLPENFAENHPEFLKAYLQAEDAKTDSKPVAKRSAMPKTKTKTVAHGWWRFCRSEAFMELSEGYRAALHRIGDTIVARGGAVPVAQLRIRHIQADIADLPRNQKRMRLKTWRALLGFLKEDGELQENVARFVQMPSQKKPDKHKPWAPEHVKAFRNHWPIGTQQRLAMELMLFVRCRISDAVRLGPGMISRDGWLRFTKQKTGGEVEMPFNCDLPDWADHNAHVQLIAALAAQQQRHMTWLVTAYGSARSEHAASNWFSGACRAASLSGNNRRTAHGLRVTCATGHAERGATTHQIGAWTGHESLKEIEGYTKAAGKPAPLSANERETRNVQVLKS